MCIQGFSCLGHLPSQGVISVKISICPEHVTYLTNLQSYCFSENVFVRQSIFPLSLKYVITQIDNVGISVWQLLNYLWTQLDRNKKIIYRLERRS